MSKTRLSKPGFSAKSVLTIMLIAASSASYAAESIDQLATRIGMDHFREAIKKGDRSAFKTLPAKGGNDSNLLIVFYVQIMPD
ncbi:hypothetical protein ACMG5I_12205, partial [Escherichia coli]